MDRLGEGIDAVVIPVGGGGLLAGMATTFKHLAPEVTVIVRMCELECVCVCECVYVCVCSLVLSQDQRMVLLGDVTAFYVQITIMLLQSFSPEHGGCKHTHPNYPCIMYSLQAAESEMCPSFSAAMKAGKPVYTNAQPSLADGLAVPKVSH